MSKVSQLDRFREAQDSAHSGFESALREIQTGRKLGHWIWYIFPQIAGLARSHASQAFAIDSEAEAVEFLRDAELRSRLISITRAVAEQLKTERAKSLRDLMGSDIDARKLVSSMTLFGHVARKLHETERLEGFAEMAAIADEVLSKAASQNYPRCEYTLRRLRGHV